MEIVYLCDIAKSVIPAALIAPIAITPVQNDFGGFFPLKWSTNPSCREASEKIKILYTFSSFEEDRVTVNKTLRLFPNMVE